MMRPHPRSRMPGITAWAQRKAPLRLTARTASHCSSVIFTAMASRLIPTLLIKISTGPRARVTSPSILSTSPLTLTSPGTVTAWPRSARMAPATSARPSPLTSVQRDAGALGGEAPRGGGPDARRRARDQHGLARAPHAGRRLSSTLCS